MSLSSTGTGADLGADGGDTVDAAVWRTAFTVIAGALAVVFDTTIVSIALNDLSSDLHTSISTIQWVSTGYLLAMFVTIPIAGWAQSALGGKRLWILALTVFLAGSMLCACAWNAGSLIAFRLVQGVGGGVMMPLMITLIMQAANGRNIGTVMSVATLPTAMGPIIGPALGGVILRFGDWRWLFLVNVPLCAIGGWLAMRNLADDRPGERRRRLDLVGLLLLSPGVAAVIFGLSRVKAADGFVATQVLVPVLGGLVLVGAFVVRAVPRGRQALVDVRLFRYRPLTGASVLGFLSSAALYGALFLLPLYWQQARGLSALGAGLLLVPQGVGTLATRRIAGALTDRVGPRPVGVAGFALTTLATVPFAFATADTPRLWLMIALLVRGAGMGAATIPLTSTAYVGLPRDDVPSASIIVRVAQQVGGSLGIAVLAVVIGSTGSTVVAFHHAFWWAVAITALAVPLCLLLPGRPRPAPPPS